LTLLGWSTLATNAFAQVHVLEVREEWELSVGEPNTDRNAPQVTMVMSPFSSLDQGYFSFLLNHRTEPQYFAGGMQVLRIADDGEVASYHNGLNQGMLNSTNEKVQWRQRLKAENGTITFEVDNGVSESWGTFGGTGNLRSTFVGGPSNLDNYRPQLSLAESGIGFAGNRVESLTLTRLEWHLSDGQTVVFTAPFDIDSDLDPWD
jgi:hypothetical protein